MLASCWLAPGVASAAECSVAVRDAVASLSGPQVGLAEARGCVGSGRVTLRLTLPGPSTIDVELALGGGGFLRGGIFAISPVMDGEWSGVQAPLRGGVEALAETLARRGGDLSRALASVPETDAAEAQSEAPPARPGLLPTVTEPPTTMSWPWLLLLGALACALGSRTPPRAAAILPVAGLFGLALVLRAAFSLFGPLHVSGQAAMWLLGAWGRPELLSTYGPGYPELFTAIARLAPGPPDRAVFWANALISSTLPPLGAALAGALGAGPRARLLFGVALAALPVAVLAGATESYHPAIGALAVGGTLALIAAARSAKEGAVAPAIARVLGGGLLLAQAARIHPIAWPIVGLAPCVLLALDGSLPQRLRRAAGFGLAAGAVVLVSSGPALRAVGELLRDPQTTGLLSRGLPWAPGAGTGLAIAFALAAARSVSPRAVGLVLAATPALLHAAATERMFAQSPGWHAAYIHTVLLIPAAVLASAVPERALAWRPLPLVVVATLLLQGRPLFAERTTIQREYAFLQEHLPALDPGCRVAYVQRAGRHLLVLPEHLAAGWDCGTTSGIVVDDRQDVLAGLLPGHCRVIYRSSLCATAAGEPLCDAFFADLNTEEIASALLPARASYADRPYLVDPVPVALLRVKPPVDLPERPLEGMRVALTIDDLPFVGPAQDGVSAATARLANALASVPTTAFANCDSVDSAGAALRPFLDAGAVIGNHQAGHDDLGAVGEEAFLRGATSCHAALTGWLGAAPRYFRYPYLRTGATFAIRDAVRAAIERLPATIAPVTIDNHEWWLAARYAESKDPVRRAEIAQAYRSHLRAATVHARQLAQDKLGRDPAQILLVHANELNADHLADLLRALADDGVVFVPLDRALQDPLYSAPDESATARGVSWLYRVAPATPPEAQHFENASWDALRARFGP